jgi:flagella basal body P-ring formation protein FlgA
MMRTISTLVSAAVALVTSSAVSAGDSPAAVLTRAMPAGTTLAIDDIRMGDPDAVALDLVDRLVGLEARRSLAAGAILRESDFRRPILIIRNAPVSMEYARGSLIMSAEGRALSNGAEGDIVKVMNSTSKTVLTAIVTGRGKVAVK